MTRYLDCLTYADRVAHEALSLRGVTANDFADWYRTFYPNGEADISGALSEYLSN